jgi:site-specific DNA-methyltransferase (adenine-specific)
MLDEVFGYDNFKNEIVWKRSNPKSLSTTNFPNCTDSIFRYSKSKNVTFNKVFGEHDPLYVDKAYKYSNKNGRKYRLLPLLNPSKNRPNLTYEFLGVTRVWRWTKNRMQKAYKKGLVVQLTPGAVPQYKKFLDESKGRTITNLWTDIEQVAGGELIGYPTQKPEALMERIIAVSSNEGGIVLDPFCGCGTTLAVAKNLNRKWIGIDISRTACYVVRDRLGEDVKIYGGETLEDVRKMNPHEVAKLIIEERWGGTVNPRKSGDMGIDGWVEHRTIPVQVKRWEHKVGRPEVDKFETAIARDNKTKGIIVANNFSKDAYAEVARIKKKNNIDIDLVEFKHIFESHNRSHSSNHGKEYIDHPAFMIL